MSKLVVCAIFDKAAQFYHHPQFFRASGAATRWFQDLVTNPKAEEIFNHADQFDLYQVAEFDDFDGHFEPLARPLLLVHGAAFDNSVAAKPV